MSSIVDKQLKILDIDDKCTGCGACVSICPKDALSLEYNDEGFYYPRQNMDRCIGCKLCEKACHVLNEPETLEICRNYTPVMLKAKDKNILKRSSSGGVFTLLSHLILEKGGVVYGARYNYEKERLEHCSTDHCDLDDLKKSKYIESYLGNIFLDVSDQLKAERHVLFVGTPCQIKGLQTFLNRKKVSRENLLLVRMICHGVPSNQFFTEYKHWQEKKTGSKIVGLDFRPKTRGWSISNMLLQFENGKKIDELCGCDYYYYYFQKNYTLRKSCYTCSHIFDGAVDITMADFWGIFSFRPEVKDKEGISLVLLHSEKARQALQSVSTECDMETLPQSAVDYIYKDSAAKKSLLPLRKKIMDRVKEKGYMKVVVQMVFFNIHKNKIRSFIRDLIKGKQNI